MLIRKGADLRYSDITPKSLYFNRRSFLAGLPVAFLAGRELLSPSARALASETAIPNLVKGTLSTTGETVTCRKDVTHYNNFYEFGTGKEQPAMLRTEASRRRLGPSRSKARSRNRSSFRIDDLMKVAPSKNASTGIAAWRRGRSWCRGRATR